MSYRFGIYNSVRFEMHRGNHILTLSKSIFLLGVVVDRHSSCKLHVDIMMYKMGQSSKKGNKAFLPWYIHNFFHHETKLEKLGNNKKKINKNTIHDIVMVVAQVTNVKFCFTRWAIFYQ